MSAGLIRAWEALRTPAPAGCRSRAARALLRQPPLRRLRGLPTRHPSLLRPRRTARSKNHNRWPVPPLAERPYDLTFIGKLEYEAKAEVWRQCGCGCACAGVRVREQAANAQAGRRHGTVLLSGRRRPSSSPRGSRERRARRHPLPAPPLPCQVSGVTLHRQAAVKALKAFRDKWGHKYKVGSVGRVVGGCCPGRRRCAGRLARVLRAAHAPCGARLVCGCRCTCPRASGWSTTSTWAC